MRKDTILSYDLRKITVFRALHLGDLLMIIPAVRSLRKQYPGAEITLVGLPWAGSFVERFNHYFDRFIEFPGFPGLPEREVDPQGFVTFLQQMHSENIDLVIQMQGSGRISNSIVRLFDANLVAGFYDQEGYVPEGYFFKYPDAGHESQRFLQLMQNLGLAVEGTELEFPVLQAEEAGAEAIVDRHQLREYVCIHTGAREEARLWDQEYFAQVADHVYEQGFQPVFTGTAGERAYVEQVIEKVSVPAVNLAGQTELGELAVLLQRSALLISNDTGVVHIAAAVGADCITMYTKGESDIARWAPLHSERSIIIGPDKADNLNYVISEVTGTFKRMKKINQRDEANGRGTSKAPGSYLAHPR